MPQKGSGGVFQRMICKTPAIKSLGELITNADSLAPPLEKKSIPTLIKDCEEDFILWGLGVATTIGIFAIRERDQAQL